MLTLTLAVTVCGCGQAPSPPPRKPVALTLSAPLDGATTRAATVQLSGSVSPTTAHVLVVGRRAAVSGGRFYATVALREGTNVIDVGAAAPAAKATWRALRVTRHSKVGVPYVLGRDADNAKATVEALGLKANVVNDDSLLDVFRSGPRSVCAMSPRGGSQVMPGSTVDLIVSKTC